MVNCLIQICYPDNQVTYFKPRAQDLKPCEETATCRLETKVIIPRFRASSFALFRCFLIIVVCVWVIFSFKCTRLFILLNFYRRKHFSCNNLPNTLFHLIFACFALNTTRILDFRCCSRRTACGHQPPR